VLGAQLTLTQPDKSRPLKSGFHSGSAAEAAATEIAKAITGRARIWAL